MGGNADDSLTSLRQYYLDQVHRVGICTLRVQQPLSSIEHPVEEGLLYY